MLGSSAMFRTGFGLSAVLAFGALGCQDDKADEGDDPTEYTPDGSDGGDGGEDDGTCGSDDDCTAYVEICEDQVCVEGDRDNTEDDATTLRYGDPSDASTWSAGVLNPVGDVDWFAFESSGAEYIRISSYTDEDIPEHNTVISLYRNNGKLVTLADGHAAGGGLGDADAVIYAYVDQAGTYLVKVEDAAGYWDVGEPYGARDYRYELLLQEWTVNVVEPDGADAMSTAIEVSSVNSWNARGVLIDEPGDLDWIQVRIRTPDAALVIDGNFDLTGSDATPQARLLDADGQVWTDRIGFGLSGIAYVPSIPEGDYLLELGDGAGAGGPNHWFFVHAIGRDASTSYPVEVEDNGPDGTPTPLDQVELETDSGNPYTLAQVEGLGDGPGDEDWFSFTSDFEGGHVVVCLLSGYYGSTALPEISVYDDSDVLLGTVASDGDTYPTAELANLIADRGDYTVRLVHGAETAGHPSDWYRMYVYVADFEVTAYDCPS